MNKNLKKYLVTFQDRVKKMTVEAESESEASVKAYKAQKGVKMYVISTRLLPVVLILFLIVLTSFQDVPGTEPLKITWHTIVLILAGLYEVIARIIPTVKNWSFLAKIIDILVWLSNFLNRKKK